MFQFNPRCCCCEGCLCCCSSFGEEVSIALSGFPLDYRSYSGSCVQITDAYNTGRVISGANVNGIHILSPMSGAGAGCIFPSSVFGGEKLCTYYNEFNDTVIFSGARIPITGNITPDVFVVTLPISGYEAVRFTAHGDFSESRMCSIEYDLFIHYYDTYFGLITPNIVTGPFFGTARDGYRYTNTKLASDSCNNIVLSGGITTIAFCIIQEGCNYPSGVILTKIGDSLNPF